jgi:hypothetical protein
MTSYEKVAGTTLLHRTEALLVKAYRATLAHGASRLRTPNGITDLYVTAADRRETVEAKRGADHRLVREALAQLLDYAPGCTEPVTHLTALFPERPERAGVALLHRYGIDCLYRDLSGSFRRLEAPIENRDYLRTAWQRT